MTLRRTMKARRPSQRGFQSCRRPDPGPRPGGRSNQEFRPELPYSCRRKFTEMWLPRPRAGRSGAWAGTRPRSPPAPTPDRRSGALITSPPYSCRLPTGLGAPHKPKHLGLYSWQAERHSSNELQRIDAASREADNHYSDENPSEKARANLHLVKFSIGLPAFDSKARKSVANTYARRLLLRSRFAGYIGTSQP